MPKSTFDASPYIAQRGQIIAQGMGQIGGIAASLVQSLPAINKHEKGLEMAKRGIEEARSKFVQIAQEQYGLSPEKAQIQAYKFYPDMVEGEEPGDVLQRMMKGSESADVYFEKAKGELNFKKASEEIGAIGQPASDSRRNEILDNMNADQYINEVLKPRAATPEQIATIASKYGVPTERFAGQMQEAVNRRSSEQIGIGSSGMTQDEYLKSVGTSGAGITPESENYAKSLPTRKDMDATELGNRKIDSDNNQNILEQEKLYRQKRADLESAYKDATSAAARLDAQLISLEKTIADKKKDIYAKPEDLEELLVQRRVLKDEIIEADERASAAKQNIKTLRENSPTMQAQSEVEAEKVEQERKVMLAEKAVEFIRTRPRGKVWGGTPEEIADELPFDMRGPFMDMIELSRKRNIPDYQIIQMILYDKVPGSNSDTTGVRGNSGAIGTVRGRGASGSW